MRAGGYQLLSKKHTDHCKGLPLEAEHVIHAEVSEQARRSSEETDHVHLFIVGFMIDCVCALMCYDCVVCSGS